MPFFFFTNSFVSRANLCENDDYTRLILFDLQEGKRKKKPSVTPVFSPPPSSASEGQCVYGYTVLESIPRPPTTESDWVSYFAWR